jgi:protein-tyrosine phosphatase
LAARVLGKLLKYSTLRAALKIIIMENSEKKYKVLFVCLGNICRSPAAQAVFEHYVREAGLQDRIQADSAGTYGGHAGSLPDRRMRTAALYRGFAVTHTARQVRAVDFLDFDLVIAMDDQNYEDLMHLAPSVEDSHKIKRMADYLTTHRISYIPDPYYMGAEGFSHVLDLLEEACANLLDSLK